MDGHLDTPSRRRSLLHEPGRELRHDLELHCFAVILDGKAVDQVDNFVDVCEGFVFAAVRN